MAGSNSRRVVAAGWVAAWGCAIGMGAVLMAAYATAPGDPGAPPDRWPAGVPVPLDRDRPTLLIFLHPLCPCSRASLDELATVLDRCGGRVAARALVYRPADRVEGWSPDDLRDALAAIPGLSVAEDPDGAEARRFGVETSGHVLLYGPDGGCRFSGGITAGRDERGESLGRSALIACILRDEGNADDPGPPVFGCPIATP